MSATDIQAVRGSFFDITASAENPAQIVRQARYLEDGLLLIKAGKILSLTPWAEGEKQLDDRQAIIDYRGKLIMPGFIDTHIHYPQTEIIGAYGEQLLEWLQRYTFPAESRYGCPHHAGQMSAFFLQQLLSNGTTTALVFGTVHPQSVDALFSAAERLGMRLIAGKVMMDRNAPDELIETAEDSYRQTRELILRWHKRGRLGYALTPRFVPTSSPELLSVVRRLRDAFPDVWVHTHLSENQQEIAWVKSLYPEYNGYLDVYDRYDLTGRRSVFAHCLHLEEHEWDRLSRTRSSIAFCPTSNLFLGSGLFRLQTCWDNAVLMGMGTDIGAGTTFSMLKTLGEAYKVGQLQHYSLSACEAVYHATLGGARALDLDMLIGNFNSGKEADFVVIDPAVTPLQRLRQDNSQTIFERLFVLMTLGDERNIAATWVNGQCVWRQGDEAAA
ncbi:guanine deaminase [Brenneria rubrifaciens]|uniref:Guanine deaminase n=1 Tax=Brenneria rubrifaciens TaxID=55213 RepID=A0A4P8QWB2_9GAMM|nr:guanine deaminase [Brenneria rubrifaciens]QCR09850.1 guanine deaminase [Brenneria rubrifaciens]